MSKRRKICERSLDATDCLDANKCAQLNSCQMVNGVGKNGVVLLALISFNFSVSFAWLAWQQPHLLLLDE